MKKQPELMRINKYLALKGFASRRGADALIEKKHVRVNGHIAQIGELVTDTDKIEVKGKQPLSAYTYYAYNKPVGIVTNSPSSKEKDVLSSIQINKELNIQPIGRLDKESSGLLLLTNDTRVVAKLLTPKKNLEKEYTVVLNEPIKRDFERLITRGVRLKNYTTKPCVVTVHNKNTFSIILTEGKNRQIRRMCSAVGYSVKELKRIRILHIELGKLGPNKFRKIEGSELETLLSTLHI